MNLLDLNKIICGKYSDEVKNKYKPIKNLKEEVAKFQKVMLINELYISCFKLTESSEEFYRSCPDFKKFIELELLEEVFYITKLGYYLEGVPSKLTFLLQKAFQKYDTPNNAVNAITGTAFGRFLKKGSLAEGITIKTVIETLIGERYQELTEFRLATKFKNCYEVYVKNVDRVVILPEDYGKYLESIDDLRTIEYRKEEGVVLCNTPLRTYGERIGVTCNEFDMRKCF